MEFLAIRFTIQFDIYGGVGHTQRENRGIEITQGWPVHMRSPHGSSHSCAFSRSGMNMEYPATHLGGLSQQRKTQADGLLAMRFGGSVPGQDGAQRLLVHAASVVADTNDQPVTLCILHHSNAQHGRASGERVHADVENV